MSNRVFNWLNIKYPQNYIIQNPYKGALFVGIFTFLFTILYRPLAPNMKQLLSYEAIMGIYCLAIALPLILLIKLLKIVPYFSSKEKWTFAKELLIEAVILTAMGIYLYFLAFVIEPPADRWNIPTFLNSMKNTYLIGVLPYLFFSIQNYKHLLSQNQEKQIHEESTAVILQENRDHWIQIDSQLKKDRLSFAPEAFVYAESDGNYVNFYIDENQKLQKKVIRNSISNIESQMSNYPHFIRTHRAFIVNLKKVTHKQGNASGYRLSLVGTKVELPVSRQNVSTFDQISKQLSL